MCCKSSEYHGKNNELSKQQEKVMRATVSEHGR